MSKAKVSLLSVAALIIGLVMGFAISSVQYRINAMDVPITLEVEGTFGSTVVATASGRVDFRSGDGLVEPSVSCDQTGSGRTVEQGGQVIAQVTTFHLDATGRATSTGESYIVGSATDDVLGANTPYVVGETEGSRIVVLEPESARAAMIRVIDILPTVLPGEHGTTEGANGLPSIAIGDDGVPTVVDGGGPVETLVQSEIIAGSGEQIGVGDTAVINYMLISPDGEVLESTWTNAEPTVLAVDDVFPGLNTGLIDSRIGSRLVLAVPASQAQGDSDVALVIDVLGRYPAE
ncbi:FKBP-type peptidyl-prolyl cis-trans isomerase [Trueperella sp.]|uniref:FKBP-type peptidyl-prolyl cis-trans isomerase n=1 Tax=Trueperella sp. TaxID=2699835 RepID=UPI0037351D4D